MTKRTLRERRERLGIAQHEVAAKMGGLAQSQVSLIELHPEKVSHRMIRRMRRAILAVELERRAVLFEERRRERRFTEEEARVASQAAMWAALPASPEKDALQAAMIERARDLMDACLCEACDAIVEWLPNEPVLAMFDEWERDLSIPPLRARSRRPVDPSSERQQFEFNEPQALP